MNSAISMSKTEVLDTVLNEFSEGYYGLSAEDKGILLLGLAKEYDLNNCSAIPTNKDLMNKAVHPISSLIDLKRRLGVGRRCFGYLHPAIPGEPLIFIEVALLKNIAQTIQEVLWDNPPMLECDATCALFYSISSTQPGLAGINLGKFQIKRVIEVVKKGYATNLCISKLPRTFYFHFLILDTDSETSFLDYMVEERIQVG